MPNLLVEQARERIGRKGSGAGAGGDVDVEPEVEADGDGGGGGGGENSKEAKLAWPDSAFEHCELFHFICLPRSLSVECAHTLRKRFKYLFVLRVQLTIF